MSFLQPNPLFTASLAVAKAHDVKLDVIIHDKKNKESHEQLLRVNPLGQVPVFVAANGYVLIECVPIASYSMSSPRRYHAFSSSRLPISNCHFPKRYNNTPRLEPPRLLRHPEVDVACQLRPPPCYRGPYPPGHRRPPASTQKHRRLPKGALHTDCRTLNNQLSKSKYLIRDNLMLADLFTVGTMVHE